MQSVPSIINDMLHALQAMTALHARQKGGGRTFSAIPLPARQLAEVSWDFLNPTSFRILSYWWFMISCYQMIGCN
jgi:hypothetical protein